MYVDIFNTDKKYSEIYADPPWSYKAWDKGGNGWDCWGNEAPQSAERDAPPSPAVSEQVKTPPHAAESEIVNNACAM